MEGDGSEEVNSGEGGGELVGAGGKGEEGEDRGEGRREEGEKRGVGKGRDEGEGREAKG